MRIEDAIQQQVFDSMRSKTTINILYTASWFTNALTRILKPFGISWQQFNILRILRGQQGKPASLRLVSDRMIDQMSNTSRLIDKLVDKGLVERRECPNDRRQVDLLVTAEGERVVKEAYEVIDQNMQGRFEHISDQKLKQLNDLLDELRN
ncbi:MAG TPA: MarR family transcriptional regulator [Saprospiraceae bacterium]|nr:MarR family transcriptional regulator [Saprospiraceae bacterium]